MVEDRAHPSLTMSRRWVLVLLVIVVFAGWGALRLARGTGASDPSQKSGALHVKYFCPMHPNIVREGPGRCPVCGMELERVDETGTVQSVEGYASFVLPARRQQLIGVVQGKVSRRPMTKIVRAAGRVTFDPDLAMAIEEYRQAAAGGSGATQDSPDAQRLRNRLLQSIAARLKLLGLTQAQINELPGRTGPAAEFLTGTTGGNVEVFLDIFPSDLGAVQPGQTLEARTLTAPGRVFHGVIKAVDRNVNPTTRTVRARALIENEEGLLRAETYLDVQIRAPLGMRLCVPADAILESGEKTLAFVISGNGRIDPRLVSVGQRGDDEVEILTGLAEGESVVTSANFLIDSESRLRSALAAFGGVAQPSRD